MTKNNKIALFVVLLLLAGGGFYWFNEEQKQKPSIQLSNRNPQQGRVDFKMSYQGQKVQGTAYRGNVYQKTVEGITFQYDTHELTSQEGGNAGANIVFSILDEQNNVVKAQNVPFYG